MREMAGGALQSSRTKRIQATDDNHLFLGHRTSRGQGQWHGLGQGRPGKSQRRPEGSDETERRREGNVLRI